MLDFSESFEESFLFNLVPPVDGLLSFRLTTQSQKRKNKSQACFLVKRLNNLALRFAWGLFEALSSEKGCCLNAWECFRFLTCSLNRLIDLRLHNLALSAERVCFPNLIQFIQSKQERQLSWLFKPGCFFCFGHPKSQSKKITGLWGEFICCTMPCCHMICKGSGICLY